MDMYIVTSLDLYEFCKKEYFDKILFLGLLRYIFIRTAEERFNLVMMTQKDES